MNIIASFLLMLLVICGGIVYPIWMIIHCITSSSLNKKTKVLCLVAILFTWSLGAFLYGLFVCEKKSAPWFSAIVILCLGLLSILPIVGMFNSMKHNAVYMAVTEFAKIDQFDTQQLTSEELSRFKASLETLQEEIKSSNLERMHKALTFLELFGIYARDNKITSGEYNAWMEKFDSRDMLDRGEFSSYVRALSNAPDLLNEEQTNPRSINSEKQINEISQAHTAIQGPAAIEYSTVKVEGIFTNSKGENFALINGQAVSEGDNIGKIKVNKINSDSVEIISNGKNATIKKGDSSNVPVVSVENQAVKPQEDSVVLSSSDVSGASSGIFLPV